MFTIQTIPVLVFSSQENGFLEISQWRPSVFDNATSPATSCLVNAHRAVFSSGQFNYTCLRIPLPSRLTGVPSSKTMWAVSFVTFSNLVDNLLRLTKLPVFRGVLTFPSAV